MGTKNNPGAFDAYEKAEPDEPMFTLLARDPLAPDIVRQWADAYGARCGIDPPAKQNQKINEAYQCADAMEKWLRENPREDV